MMFVLTIFGLVLLLIASPVRAGSFDNCRDKLIKAQRLDVLADLDWKPPRQPKVVVGPTFFSMPFHGKQGFVETVNCFLVAGEDKYVDFDVVDHMNHRIVGRWENGRLSMK